MKLLLSITYVALLGILAHYIGESLPRCWFSGDRFPYSSFRWEHGGKFYDRLQIRKWKTKVPDMSRVMKDMLPKRLDYGATSESVEILIKETCVAEFMHQFLCVFSIGVFFIWKDKIGVLLVFVCILGNLPFIIIQRYNRPHLLKLRNHLTVREERKRLAVADSVL